MLNNWKIKTASVTGEIELSGMECMLKVKPNVIVAMKCCIDEQIMVAVLAAVLSFTSIKTNVMLGVTSDILTPHLIFGPYQQWV